MFCINHLWAKTDPFKSLETHMIESGYVATQLLQESSFSPLKGTLALHLGVSEEDACRFAAYLAALHDIGKCHPQFQGKSEAIRTALADCKLSALFQVPDYRHEMGSSKIAQRIWKELGRFAGDGINRLAGQFASVLKMHHQGKTGKDYPLDARWEASKTWQSWQDELEALCYHKFMPPRIAASGVVHMDCACMILTAIVIVSDWIASGEDFPNTEGMSESEIQHTIKEHITSLGIGEGTLPASGSITDVWPWLTNAGLRPLQKGIDDYLAAREEMPLAMIIEAPMGEGKTEAGVYAAIQMAKYWGKSGLYMALPTSATSNQMIGRLNSLFSAHKLNNLKLIHSLSWLQEGSFGSNKNQDGERWLASSRKALLAPSAVGTVDQAMMAALRVKYGVLRLLGLSSKVLIIDEIHAYDAYMSTIVERLLEWCRDLRIPVVLMSATLPLWKKKELMSIYGDAEHLTSSHQMVTAAFQDGVIETQVYPKCAQTKAIALDFSKVLKKDFVGTATDRAVEAYAQGGCVCVIANTVGNVQAIYDSIIQRVSADKCILFHSAFSVGRRLELENKCLDVFSPKRESRATGGMILVATQVVEQSLDLDFDYMISEIAPVDILLQRAGRLHRHFDVDRPKALAQPVMTVVSYKNDDYGSTECIYYRALLDRTANMLSRCVAINIPEDIPVMVEEVYQQDSFGDKEREDFFKQLFGDELLKSAAESCELRTPNPRHFILGDMGGMGMFDDTESSFTTATTRMAEESVRFGVLPKTIYNDVASFVERGEKIPRTLAKEAYFYTASRSKKQAATTLADVEHIVGTGLLDGIYLYKSDNDSVSFSETLFSSNGPRFICMDKDRGVLLV